MQVLDGQHEGAVAGQFLEQVDSMLEELGTPVLIIWSVTRSAKVGKQAGELALRTFRCAFQIRAQIPVQPAQCGDQGRERQVLGAHFEAVTQRGDRTGLLGHRQELLQQSGLADTRLTPDQHGRRFSGRRSAQGPIEHCEFTAAADEGRADRGVGRKIDDVIERRRSSHCSNALR
ncbi:hypothetical protein ADL25_42975 [Streptomyces sp. NRRL F-5122]|nr:hypothetical protein ADL25_42975 [Streptomyces sp. NRRL F-5122]